MQFVKLVILISLFLISASSLGQQDLSARSDLMLASILRSAPTGIGVVKNRVFTQVNEYVARLTGYSESELVGKSSRILYPSDAEFEYVGKEKYRQIKARGYGSVETEWRRKDGQQLHVILSSTPLDPKDLEAGVVFTVLDVTNARDASEKLKTTTNYFLLGMSALLIIQLILIIVLINVLISRKKIMDDLQKSHEELEIKVDERTKELKESNERLTEFAHVVSHDMKGPLRGISTLVTYIEEDQQKLSQSQSDFFGLIKNRVKRLYSQIDSILTYSTIGANADADESIDTDELVKEVIDMLQPPASFLFEISKLPQVTFSRQKLYQVFQNLISNAIKFSSSDGAISIGASDEKTFWKFFVRDNGEGIEEKYFEKIFNLFQTLHSKDEIEGSGIGLALVKKIIEGGGGTITVESTVGKGTTFYFTIKK